ncbi:MAG: YceI family protein [Bacteroidetes bacterium]|nr:YceI family protein [Bacteroidota bacterium]
MKKVFLPIFIALACTSFCPHSSDELAIQTANVSFVSSANFETIKGASTDVKGTVDVSKRTFSFSIPLSSFQGFINAQQKKHFNEKFVESPKYPETSFKGKIIEDVNLAVPGTYTVRGKGMLLLHGVEKERIIDAKITVKEGQISVDSGFSIPLEDHGIKVSKMNSLAIAKVVNVTVKIALKST